jgi:hypothetical protein
VVLIVDPAIPRITQRELLDHVTGLGYNFSAASFRDWQSKGFIANPSGRQRWAQGRPGSKPGLWSQHQRDLLVELLRRRDESLARGHGRDISGLGNIVVWFWLFPDGIVDTPQAAKALTTWVRPQVGKSARVPGGARSHRRMYEHAGQLVRQVGGPGLTPRVRDEVVGRLTDLQWLGQEPNLTQLSGDFSSIIDPAGDGRHIGSTLAPVGPHDAAATVAAKLAAAEMLLADPGVFSEGEWALTRDILRNAWTEYERDWRRLDLTSDVRIRYDEPTLAYQVRSSAVSVLAILGTILLKKADALP